MRCRVSLFCLLLTTTTFACSDHRIAKLEGPEAAVASDDNLLDADTASSVLDSGTPPGPSDTGNDVDTGVPGDTGEIPTDDDPLEAPRGLRWCTDVSLECLVYCEPGTQEAHPALDLECALALDPCSSDAGWAALWFPTAGDELILQGLLATEAVRATCEATAGSDRARFERPFDLMARTGHATRADAGWIWVGVDTETTPVPAFE